MSEDLVLDIAREAILTVITVGGPILLIALIIGLTISIFQTVTSIQEQTLSYVPKILAVFIGLLVLAPWMMNKLVELTTDLYSSFSILIKS
jgi:flagellar biosynthetic protein FliQ